ncbi:MAG: hypothetical protein AAF636_13685 [Pseudomonadota bacterium]
MAAGLAAAQDAGAQTADDVLNRMSDEERFAYLSGVVEGLATSRWVADQPDSSRMQCVYDWYFGQNVKVRQTVIAWLERNPDQRAGILMHVLVERQCPNE